MGGGYVRCFVQLVVVTQNLWLVSHIFCFVIWLRLLPQEEGPVGTLILFSLPRHQGNNARSAKVYQCVNVRVGADTSFSPRNRLWRVEGIPRWRDAAGDSEQEQAFDLVCNLPGYLFFNDEEDGFRLTWAMEEWNTDEGQCTGEIADSPLAKTGIDSAATIISHQDTWEVFYTDVHSGKRLPPPDNDESSAASGIGIVSEAFLHIDALLGEILDRRKGISETHPEFYYNLISVNNAGRVADLIITFIRKQKSGSLGVFIKVDLFTGRYQELDWVKSLGMKDTSALRSWCNTLALNRRMRQVRAGPYSIEAKHSIDWGRLCNDSYFDYDKEDDVAPSFWRGYVENAESIMTKKPPKSISLSSLYPHCDLVTNKAITSCLPVASLQCKHSPVELVYG
jgi:hypothetical protein